jgi:hypothetical protein
VSRQGGRTGRHYGRLRGGGPVPDFCERVRSGRGGLTHKPGTMRSLREQSIGRGTGVQTPLLARRFGAVRVGTPGQLAAGWCDGNPGST